MKITDKLKEDVKAAVVIALDAFGSEPDIEQRLTDAVLDVVAEIPDPVSPGPVNTLPVKYIWKEEVYYDGLFDTGIWSQGQTKRVPAITASKMFGHPDVYIPGDEGIAADTETVTNETEEQKEKSKEEALQDIRDLIYAMTKKKGIIDYVAANFNGLKMDLPATAKVSEYQQKAIQLVDQYGVPE